MCFCIGSLYSNHHTWLINDAWGQNVEKKITQRLFFKFVFYPMQTEQVLIMLFHRTSFSPCYASSKATGNIHISLFYPSEAKRGLRSMIYNGQRVQVILEFWHVAKTNSWKNEKISLVWQHTAFGSFQKWYPLIPKYLWKSIQTLC